MSFGVIVNESTAPPATGAPTDTGQAFVAGVTGSGESAVTECHGLDDYEAVYGPRSGAHVAVWDWLDLAFREGVNTVFVAGYAAAGGFEEALAAFDSRLGPGQVTIVGEPATPETYEAIQAHVDANNRVGLLDVNIADDTATELEQRGTDAQALGSLENVAVFGSYLNCGSAPGVTGSGPRQLPASAAIAGLCNRVDLTGNPNTAAGGRDFPLQYASSPIFDPNDSDRSALFAKGVNMFANRFGILENYGFQTPVAQSPDTPFWQFNCSRARMWLKAQALAIGESFYMRTIDGAGKLAAELGGELAVPCADLYAQGGLFGDAAADAYSINVSQTVNTDATAANATLKAVMQARLSEYAKVVQISLVSVPVSGAIS